MRRGSTGIVVAGAAAGLIGWAAQLASSDDIRDAEAVRTLYDRLAPSYDAAAWVFQPIGGRRLRDRALDLLELAPGDTVVDLGCGTGVNLAPLSAAVGANGRVLGIDLSPGMLDRARLRADHLGLSQVTLVQADMRDFEMPADTTAVLATSSLEMVPEHDAVLSALAERLAPTGRIAVVGLRHPETWPAWAIAMARTATAVFGVTRAYEQVRPWESVHRHYAQVHYETALGGAMYLVVGRARPEDSPAGP